MTVNTELCEMYSAEIYRVVFLIKKFKYLLKHP